MSGPSTRNRSWSKPDESDRRALLEDDRTFVPAYLGPSGWVGLDLDADTDWTEVA